MVGSSDNTDFDLIADDGLLIIPPTGHWVRYSSGLRRPSSMISQLETRLVLTHQATSYNQDFTMPPGYWDLVVYDLRGQHRRHIRTE